jgi:outer membrane lipopolysaccharide assembly protein LptE/RlpB
MNFKKKALLLSVIIILAAGFSSGCGFRVLNGSESSLKAGLPASVGKKSKRYNDISGIYVKPFKNLTYKSGVGVYFSNNIAKFLNMQTYMFTSNENGAFYYLSGKITSMQNNVMSYTGVAAAVDYDIAVNVSVSMYNTDGKIIFRNVNFSSSATYYNYINPLVAHKQEKEAIIRASRRIARKIVIYIESKKLTS